MKMSMTVGFDSEVDSLTEIEIASVFGQIADLAMSNIEKAPLDVSNPLKEAGITADITEAAAVFEDAAKTEVPPPTPLEPAPPEPPPPPPPPEPTPPESVLYPPEASPPPPEPASTTETVEVDVKGYPWDYRIHASSKTRNKTGEWRLRKKVDPEMVTDVRAEFDRNSPPATAPVSPTQTNTAAPPPPQSDRVAAPPPPSTVTLPTTIPGLFQRLNHKVDKEGYTMPTANEVARKHGLESFAYVTTIDASTAEGVELLRKIIADIG